MSQGNEGCEVICNGPLERFVHEAKFDWLYASRYRAGCDPPVGRTNRSAILAKPIEPRPRTARANGRAVFRLARAWLRRNAGNARC